MKRKYTNIITISLIIVLIFQTFCACDSTNINSAIENEDISAKLVSDGMVEDVISEDVIYEDYIREGRITEEYVKENTIYEDGIYECKISETLTCETYVFETVIDENSEKYFLENLPEGFEEYDVDWAGVIKKLAIGTVAIVAVGIIKGSEFTKPIAFAFSSPVEITKNAFAFGAMAAAGNVALNSYQNGCISESATKKYAIEGFAEGYMWGAITSVLKVDAIAEHVAKRFKVPKVDLQIIDGIAVDKEGTQLGTAWSGETGIYVLTAIVSKCKVKGKYSLAGKKLKTPRHLPKNAELASKNDIIYTDARGCIMRKNDKLLPNIMYKLKNGARYATNNEGRIIRVTQKKLGRKTWKGRLKIKDDMATLQQGNVKPGYQLGHLIADRFGGDNTIANLIPMSQKANQKIYKKIEDEWDKILRNNGKVTDIKIEVKWKPGSSVPDEFTVSYKANGKQVSPVTISNKL